MKRGYFIFIVALFLLGVSTSIYLEPVYSAPIVKEVYYQKKTTLSYPAIYTLRFSLWDTETGGAASIWSEEKPINMTSATIKTYLGEISSLDGVDFSQQYWVQVERKKKNGTYVPIAGRDMFVVVPYALHSETSAGVPGSISGITAGAGLTGGGTSGTVPLDVGAGTGITVGADAISVNTSVIQSRVAGTCAAGSSIRTINSDGTVVCQTDTNSGGDITGVIAGTGLTGGGLFGDVTLGVSFGGTGAASTVSRSDHNHDATYVNEGQANSITTNMIATYAVDPTKIAYSTPSRYEASSPGADETWVQMGQWKFCFLSEYGALEGAANATWHYCKVIYDSGTSPGTYWLVARGGSISVDCAALCMP